jgi:hypothetical protein
MVTAWSQRAAVEQCGGAVDRRAVGVRLNELLKKRNRALVEGEITPLQAAQLALALAPESSASARTPPEIAKNVG